MDQPATRTTARGAQQPFVRPAQLFVACAILATIASLAPAPASAGALARAGGAIVFAFDDGCDSHLLAASALEARGARGTFYLTSGGSFANASCSRFLTPSEIASLAARGHDIKADSISHRDLTTLSDEALRRELADSQATLRARLVHAERQVEVFGNRVVFESEFLQVFSLIRRGNTGEHDQRAHRVFGCSVDFEREEVLDLSCGRHPRVGDALDRASHAGDGWVAERFQHFHQVVVVNQTVRVRDRDEVGFDGLERVLDGARLAPVRVHPDYAHVFRGVATQDFGSPVSAAVVDDDDLVHLVGLGEDVLDAGPDGEFVVLHRNEERHAELRPYGVVGRRFRARPPHCPDNHDDRQVNHRQSRRREDNREHDQRLGDGL